MPMVRSTAHQRPRLPLQCRPWPSIVSSSCWDSFSLDTSSGASYWDRRNAAACRDGTSVQRLLTCFYEKSYVPVIRGKSDPGSQFGRNAALMMSRCCSVSGGAFSASSLIRDGLVIEELFALLCSAIGLVWSVHPGGVDDVTGQVDAAVVDEGQNDGHSFCHVMHRLCKFGWHLGQDRVGELAEASAEA